jgi:putative membrane protein
MDKSVKTVLIIGSIIVGVLVILPLVFGFLWGWQGYGYGMMGPGMMGGFNTMFFMPIIWLFVIGLIVWAVAGTVRRSGESDSTWRSADSALEILKRRYARGEIGKEEYEAKKKDLV